LRRTAKARMRGAAMRANMQAKGQGKKRDDSGREFVGTRSIAERMGGVQLSHRHLIVWHGAHHTNGPWRGMLCKEANFTTKTRRTRSSRSAHIARNAGIRG